MKTANSESVSQNLAGIVQTARLRVATAESQWKTAKEQARAAKRRRKEVKLIARRAKKQAKEAKAELAEARKALAEAEVKLAQSGIRRATRKLARVKAKPVVRRAVAAPKTKTAPARKSRSRPLIPSPAPGSKVQVARVSPQASASSLVPPQAESVIGKPGGGTPETTVITGAVAVAATQTQPIQGIQAGRES